METKTPVAGTVVQQSRFNRFMARWLASPFGVLSGRVVLVRYTGRVSGLPRQLPVNCEPFEGGYLIRVGRPEQKSWWRNFTSPWPIEIVRKGRRIPGSAVVVPGTTGRGQRIAADYFATHHGAAKRAGLPKMHKGELPTPEALQAAAATLVFVVVTPEK
ncbi:MAG: hypothetical protein ABSD62_05260 [Candidatus Limnocylindrales bacterium]|jgi:hypothetical protein